MSQGTGSAVAVVDIREVLASMMERHPTRPYNAFADGWQAALDELDDWLDTKAESPEERNERWNTRAEAAIDRVRDARHKEA